MFSDPFFFVVQIDLEFAQILFKSKEFAFFGTPYELKVSGEIPNSEDSLSHSGYLIHVPSFIE